MNLEKSSALLAGLVALLCNAVVVSAPAVSTSPPSTAAITSTGGDYRYIPIPVPSGRGHALGVSDDRTVVGYSIEHAAIELPFVYTETFGVVTLPIDTGMRHGVAEVISPNGHYAAGWEETPAGDCWVVRWTRGAGPSWSVTQLVHHDGDDPDHVGCGDAATGVGDDGKVAITTAETWGAAGPASGLLWTDAGTTTLTGQPLAMAADGTLAGYVPTGTGTLPWNSVVGAVPGPETAGVDPAAHGISRDGSMIVDAKDPGSGLLGYPSLRRPDGTYLPLTGLPAAAGGPGGVAKSTAAWAISDSGEAVGESYAGSVDGVDVQHAVRWNADGSVTDLNDVTSHTILGETLLSARAVDTDGDIVGDAVDNTTDGHTIPMLLVASPPIVFVPGVAGSHLVDAAGDEAWIDCLGDHTDLGLPPDGSTTIHADEVLQYDTCAGVYDNHDTDAYGPFIDALKARGMREYDGARTPSRWTTAGCDTSQRSNHPNLFLFPYDWRSSNAVSARKLADFMGCVREFYTGPVVLVAHSMGGLVSRRYVLDHPEGTSHVRDLITIGTPWLGAPKLLRAEETGDFIPNLMFNSTVRRIIPTMPGPGELLPSKAYYQVADTPLAEDGWDLNGNATSTERYTHSQVDALLDAQFANHTAITDGANAFHDFTTPEGSQDDWRTDTTGVRYTVLYGVHQQTDTPGPVTAKKTVSCRPVVALGTVTCSEEPTFEIELVDGDGTVPVQSALRKGMGEDLNNADSHVERLIPVYGSTYGDDTTEHTGLTRNEMVQNTVLDTDQRGYAVKPPGSAMQAVRHAAGTTAESEWTIDLQGIVGTSTVTAPDGSTDAVRGGFRPALPGVSHHVEGTSSELDVLPDVGATYEMTATAGTSPLQIDVRRGGGAGTSQRSVWRDLSVPAGHVATLTITDTTVSLSYDSDGTGGVDTAVPATFTPSGTELDDLDAPVISMGAIVEGGARQYALRAHDLAGGASSGVKQIWWSVDGTTFRRYVGPIALDPATAHLTAFAEDYAGNRSGLQTLAVDATSSTPLTTATLDREPGPNGWITEGPVTVHFHAQAPDGTTITALHYGIGYPSQVVGGADATLTFDAAHSLLFFYAEDSSGDIEPTDFLAVKADTEAPTSTISLPADGSSRTSLGAIQGRSVDSSASGSGVASTKVTITRESDGRHWNGTGWQVGAVRLATGPGAHPWEGDWELSSGLPAVGDLTAGAYTVSAQATDAAGNVGVPAVSVVTITTDSALRMLDVPGSNPVSSGTYLDTDVWAHAIDDSGRIAGGSISAANVGGAVRWDPDGSTHVLAESVHVPPADGRAINSSGTVAGSGPWQSELWRTDGTSVLLPPGPTGTYPSRVQASAINDAGVAAAAWGTWNGLSFQPLPTADLDPGHSFDARVTGIDDQDTVVGSVGHHRSDGFEYPTAVMADATAVTRLFPPSGDDPPMPSSAEGVDGPGRIVGWANFDGTDSEPFLRGTDGTVTRYDLAQVGQTCGTATAVNVHDVVVGYGGRCGWLLDLERDRSEAWVIRGGTVQTLDSLLPADTGWKLEQANDINDSGQIVGVGTVNGHVRGFELDLGALPDPNHAPTAIPLDLTTPKDTALGVTLQGSDPDGDALTWSVVTPPAHGTLSPISGAGLTYTPTAGWSGTDTFVVRASDGRLSSNEAAMTVDVTDPPPPVVALILGPSAVVEGSSAVLDGSGSFTNPGGGPLGYHWDLDGDGTYGDASGATITLTSLPLGSFTVGLEVTGAGGSDTTTHEVTVVAAAPVVTGLSDTSLSLGETYAAAGTVAQAGSEAVTSVTVDYGDGTGPQPLDPSAGGFSWPHRYTTSDAFGVTVTACNSSGLCGSDTATVVVQAGPAPPVILQVTGLDFAAVAGSPAHPSVATFTLTGADVTSATATVDWGDGVSSAGTIDVGSGTPVVSGTHTYAGPGSYPVVVTVAVGAATADTTVIATVSTASTTTSTTSTTTSTMPGTSTTTSTPPGPTTPSTSIPPTTSTTLPASSIPPGTSTSTPTPTGGWSSVPPASSSTTERPPSTTSSAAATAPPATAISGRPTYTG